MNAIIQPADQTRRVTLESGHSLYCPTATFEVTRVADESEPDGFRYSAELISGDIHQDWDEDDMAAAAVAQAAEEWAEEEGKVRS